MKPLVRDGIRIREESWGAILYDSWLSVIYALNEDGYRIFMLCDGENTIEDITEIISKEYRSSPEEIKPQVEKYLRFLQNRKIIVYETVTADELIKTHFEGTTHKAVKYGGETPEIVSGFEQYRERSLSAPLSVSFEITSKCNLRCQHCYANAGDSLEGELTTEQILKFIDELAEMKIFSMAISGGEPMTRSDIFQIVERCLHNGIPTLLSTNGTLITREVARKLKTIGLRGVQVSIDSVEPKIHDTFRGVPGAYERAMRGLKNLLQVEIEIVRVATVASKLNFNEIPKLVDQLDNMGISHQRILRFLPIGRGKGQGDLALSNEEIKKLLRILEKKQDEPGNIIVDFSDAFNPPIVDRPTHACTGGVLWCAINPNGYVVPCTYLNSRQVALNLHAESIAKKDFQDIWKNYELFRTLRNPNLFLKGKCGRCRYKPTCGGGCRAAAYAYTKDILAPDPHCSYEPDVKELSVN